MRKETVHASGQSDQLPPRSTSCSPWPASRNPPAPWDRASYQSAVHSHTPPHTKASWTPTTWRPAWTYTRFSEAVSPGI